MTRGATRRALIPEIPDATGASASVASLTAVRERTGRRSSVLLLNATYEPLTAVSTRRAIVLVLAERADMLHENAGARPLHSAGLDVAVPSVIRLRTYVRVPYVATIPLSRGALMHRDGHRCAYCGGRADTIDHVVPRSRGGGHHWENCVACCAPCNHRKADRLLSELGWTLRLTPIVPKGRAWRLLSTVKEVDPSWSLYLGRAA